MRIEIAGALATGKSTVAGILRERGFHLVSENLANNPYLEMRKVDPVKYEFLCQQRFVADKLDAIEKAIAETSRHIVSDYCLAAEKAYIVHYLSYRPEWVERLVGQIDEGESRIGKPDCIVHLRCRPETQVERIRRRGRDFEQGHDVAFVSAIKDLVGRQVALARAAGVQVVEIDVDGIEPSEAAGIVCGLVAGGAQEPAREAALSS